MKSSFYFDVTRMIRKTLGLLLLYSSAEELQQSLLLQLNEGF